MQYTGMKDAFDELLKIKGQEAFKDKNFVITAFRDFAGESIGDWLLVRQIYLSGENTVYRLVDRLIRSGDVKKCVQETTRNLQMEFLSEECIRIFLEAILDVYGASAAKKSIYFSDKVVSLRKDELKKAFKNFFRNAGEIQWSSNEELIGVFTDVAPGLRTPEGKFLSSALEFSDGKVRDLMIALIEDKNIHAAYYNAQTALEKIGFDKRHIEVFLDSMWEVYQPPRNPVKTPLKPLPVKQGNSGKSVQNTSGKTAHNSTAGAVTNNSTQKKSGNQAALNKMNSSASSGNVSVNNNSSGSGVSSAQKTSGSQKHHISGQITSQINNQTTSQTRKVPKKKINLKIIIGIVVLLLFFKVPSKIFILKNSWDMKQEQKKMERKAEELAKEMEELALTVTPTLEPTPTPDPINRNPAGTYKDGMSFDAVMSASIVDTDISITPVTAPDYSVVTDPANYRYFVAGNYTFAYPKNLYSNVVFNNESHGDVTTTTFTSDDGSMLSFSRGISYTKVNESDVNTVRQRQTEDMTECSVLVDSLDTENRLFRYYVTGKDAANPNLVVCKAINWGKDIYLYVMTLKYPVPTDETDSLCKKYYEEFLYRSCEFADSTSEARTFEEFLENN